jgi:tRNA pseudouridine38-40 synthase
MRLAYDGGPFVGWQRQAQGRSVQGLLEEALARIEGAPVAVVGAGRTDAGVHATGQVASARFRHRLDVASLRRALNATLPAAIRVLDVEDVPAAFHARFNATAKVYRYVIANGESINPFDAAYAWRLSGPLDLDAMAQAARRFVGSHDFAAFLAAGSSVTLTRRTVTRSVVGRLDLASARADGLPPGTACADLDGAARITYEIAADGFLRHMVRTIVGTLVEAGQGRREPASIEAILESRDRGAAGPTAPAHGLCLVRVEYGQGREIP